MGRPLEMEVPARFESGPDGGECVHADVFYGESRVATTRVRATVLGSPEHRHVRVESDRPIDEPVVTVSLRAGCRTTLTRNYTLLPEFPSQRALDAADARTAMADATPVPPKRPAKAAARPAPRAPAARAVPHRGALAQAGSAARPVGPARHRHKARVHAEAPARGPRLQLESVEPPPTASLRVSPRLAAPEGDAGRRAAAALLWQAINADPQEILRTNAMLQKLEQDLAALREDAAQSRQQIAALRQRLDPARPWYASELLVLVLALLVLAAAAAAGVVVYRMRQARRWEEAWYELAEPADPAPHDAERVVGEVAPHSGTAPAATTAPVFAPRDRADAADPPPAAQGEDSLPAARVEFTPAQALPRRPDADERRALAALRVEALAATLAEVEFLEAVDHRQDAVDRLKAYLQDSSQPVPLAYLELMRLTEEAGDRTAVAAVRRRYASTFGVEAPSLAQITADTGVEAMPELSARIARTRGSPEELPTLEQALFRAPTPAVPISLRAGRELLSLHALALALAPEQGGAAVPADAQALAPWAGAQDAREAQAALAQAPQRPGGRFGLDLDLSIPAADAAEVSTTVPADPPPLPALPDPQAQPVPPGLQAASERELERRREEEAAEAFSAAVASERIPASRY